MRISIAPLGKSTGGRLAIAVVAALAVSACGPREPNTGAMAPIVRRLTETQYHNIIGDVFGQRISISGQVDPLVRTDGLYALGASSSRMTPSGMDQFDGRAQSIAAQVTGSANRDVLIGCKPADPKTADDACATGYFSRVGRLLYRRALNPSELSSSVKEAHAAAVSAGDFYQGISAALAGMLVSPQFLYVVDATQPDKSNPGHVVLTPYAKAARLTFFLWDTAPTDQLLTAAEKGELDTRAGLEHEVDRMVASPRLGGGVRAFFSDMLDLDDFGEVEKDSIIYPAYSLAVANDAKEQTLRTIVDLLVTKRGDYRDLFTTRNTFMSGPLGRIYHIPINRPDAGWMRYTFPKNDPHSGILTFVSFDAQYAHPGRSSPTRRGRAIREELLCQMVPNPPGDVDFSKFNNPDPANKTARQVLTAHRTNPTCAGCHKVMDPIGLSLENFDGAGQVRYTENGAPIDPSGELDGAHYADAAGLGRAMHDSPAVGACLVQRSLAYGLGHPVSLKERPLVDFLTKEFVADGYRFPDLMRQIVMSKAFFTVTDPQSPATPSKTHASSEAGPQGPANAKGKVS